MSVKVIAECGACHNGSLKVACEMIEEAKYAGADFVKFQKRDVSLMSDEARDRPYTGPNSFGQTYGEHRAKLEFNREEWECLFKVAKDYKIGMFASVFDIPSARFIREFDPPVYKIGSANTTDGKLIEEVAGYGKTTLISTGMSTEREIDMACNAFDGASGVLVLMQCTSDYPCAEENVNLRVLENITDSNESIVGEIGLSGHYTSGNGAIEAAAVALGATWIERHFTLDRTMKGTDHIASLEPEGLRRVVKAVRSVERAMGSPEKRVLDCELPAREKFRK